MARHRGPPRGSARFTPVVVRTSKGRLAVVVCDLFGAFVLWQGRDQYERWHRSVVATPPSGDDPIGPIMLIAGRPPDGRR